ncbi:hypothetical protein Ahy_B06g080388 [Arachis hypogaea]|uniref:Uncharacterized protein n=1 Tax=Arachis hypogaea TaxID=3818 RepID=A0A444YHU6_ARAHY|nr:hypothetical protein Ahy_B06g080388 [Arachis hypogaea]
MTEISKINKQINKSIRWYYDFKLGDKHHLLPPRDMGWPLLGNTWHYLENPLSFIPNFLSTSLFHYFLIPFQYNYYSVKIQGLFNLTC